MARAWERLQKHQPPSLPVLGGRTVGELEELFCRPVRDLSEAELTEFFGFLAPEARELNTTVGRAISWARSRLQP